MAYLNRENLLQIFACETSNTEFGQKYYAGIYQKIMNMPTADVVEVKHGEWIVNPESVDGWKHHMCSACHTDAIFGYKYEADYDEMLDGEWEYIGQREVGINELLASYCPNCGAKMDGGKE